MLLTLDQARFLGKYLDHIDDGMYSRYRLREGIRVEDIPSDDLAELKDYDDSYFLLYGRHMVEDYDKLFGR